MPTLEMMFERDAKITALKAENFELRARIAELEAPTLELVGGKWEEVQPNHWQRCVDGYCMHVLIDYPDCETWCFQILGREYPRLMPTSGYPNREAAMEAAEKALLEEVGKFVGVKK